MSPSHRPRRLGAVLSILVGALAIGLVADSGAQHTALAVGTVGAIVLWGGIRRSKRSLDGILVVVVGLGVVAAGLGLGAVGPRSFRRIVELVPGLVGLAVLGAGVAPVRDGRKRLLIGVGTGLVFVSVLASGAVRGASTLSLLVAGAATVVAWDLAEQAVSLSEQVGERADTSRAELVHGGATAGIATAAVGATWVVDGAGVSGLPLVAVLFLLGAAMTLTLVLYN